MPHGFELAFGPASEGHAHATSLCFVGKELLVTAEGSLPAPSQIEWMGVPQHRHVIGQAGDAVVEMQVWPADAVLPPGLSKADLRKTLANWPQALADAACRARQLATWLGETRYCGACGGTMETEAHAAARKCPACGFVAYPRISPVGIVLVTRGDEILLARSPHFTPGTYSALAGYAEAGESLEACIHREVREEVGIEIRDLRWFGSQSWPLTNALMLGFLAEYDGGTLNLQQDEIEDAQWFRRDNLPTLPHHSTLAYRMIRAWGG
ncbi:MAG TPA: NAD(+) diphosphatase [Gallionella sp.]|nr:NAD(+) diphosphatase [Gallionella sp.]